MTGDQLLQRRDRFRLLTLVGEDFGAELLQIDRVGEFVLACWIVFIPCSLANTAD